MELAKVGKTGTTPAHTGARHGGRVLADALVAQGVDHVFEVPGESFLDTLDGLYDQGGIKLVSPVADTTITVDHEGFILDYPGLAERI